MKTVKLSEIILDDHNANEHTERGEYAIRKSLERFGFAEAGTLDKHNRVIGGNLRTEAAADVLAAEDAIVIDVDGTKPVYIRRNDLDLDTPRGRELAVALNRVPEMSQFLNPDVLTEYMAGGVDLSDWYHPLEMEYLGIGDIEAVGTGRTHKDGGEGSDELPPLDYVPDTVWPSDNEYGIPSLLPHRQARVLDLPVTKWGIAGRGRKVGGTLLFYTDDYKFNGLWREPDKVVLSGAANVIEPNFSTGEVLPAAVVLWAIYRKRWLARYWQECGVNVIVDLAISDRHRHLSLLGVPKGWRAYATNVNTTGNDYTLALADWEQAKAHAGSDDILFIAYGGGRDMEKISQERGWIWIPRIMGKSAYNG